VPGAGFEYFRVLKKKTLEQMSFESGSLKSGEFE